jgi:hypothetical protein
MFTEGRFTDGVPISTLAVQSTSLRLIVVATRTPTAKITKPKLEITAGRLTKPKRSIFTIATMLNTSQTTSRRPKGIRINHKESVIRAVYRLYEKPG